MGATEEILAQLTGARFYRADMHIHSYPASHDVHDVTMTPQAIVATAQREHLDVIAITDHNEIGGVESALTAATNTGILVVPGVELSTSDGHLLCYFETIDQLKSFYGRLSIVDRGLQTSRCQKSLLECLNITGTLGGIGVLAHVDFPSGFEHEVPGASPHKIDVVCHPALLAIELKLATSTVAYAPGDTNPERMGMGQERIKRLQLGSKQHLARVLNSDAHALNALGRNAEKAKKVTRYKMDAPTFSALRVALEDADARVRIEDQIPPAIPRIVGLHIDGGFLNGQAIQFSPNLNCIVGGRGTGKSTTFEAVRCLIDEAADRSSVVDSEVWPEELLLIWKDRAGQDHTLVRHKDGDIYNLNDRDAGPFSFDIDCFGQGEAAKISIQAQTNPLALLHYLDRFINLDEAQSTENLTREKLLSLQTDIEAAEHKVQLIPQYERQLATTKQQLAALQKPDVKELIQLQRKLATEREVRSQISEKLRDAKQDSSEFSPGDAARQIRELANPAELAVGALEFQAISAGASTLETAVSAAAAQIKTEFTLFEKIVNTQMASWKLKEGEAQKQVDAKRRELEALNVSFDMSYISKLAKDEATHQQNIKSLRSWIPHLKELRQQRSAALVERWAARDRVATLRETFGRNATKTLRESLSDLQVSLKYSRNAHSPDAADQIIDAMGWRTNQQPRAKWLVQELTIPILLDAIQKNTVMSIVALKTPEGVPIFSNEEAKAIIEKLSVPKVKFALERAALHDLPRLQVTRPVTDENGQTRHIPRDFSKLSLGQQQSVLLALMLSSGSDRPLIIDQPEDNLDGEFIYKTLVPVLRRAKERRQVIIVTHNSNVAVLGDAELIVVMKANNERGMIVTRGSIDHAETCEAACSILEGAREAFLRRAKMYGVSLK